jgi:hypothetical protein
VTAYVVAKPIDYVEGAGFYAVEFYIDASNAVEYLYLYETHEGSISYGSLDPATALGIQIGFDTCQEQNRVVATVLYFVTTQVEETRYLDIVPSNLATNQLAMADCSPLRTTRPVLAGQGCIWPEGTRYGCILGTPPCYPEPVAIEETTWGSIKVLYKE